MIFVFLILLTVSLSCGKVYKRCELAKELKNVHNVPMHQLGTWVCIAEHESRYKTDAIGRLGEKGTADHGIFQINDKYWCSPPGQGRACGLTCSKLEDDDITDDFKCAQKIHKEHEILSGDGFNAWVVYEPHCKGSKAEKYLKECFGDAINTEGTKKPGRKNPQSPQILEQKEFKKSSMTKNLQGSRLDANNKAFRTIPTTTETKQTNTRRSGKPVLPELKSEPKVTTVKSSLADHAETILNFMNTVINDIMNNPKHVYEGLNLLNGHVTYTINFMGRNSMPSSNTAPSQPSQSPSSESYPPYRPVFIFNNMRWY